MITRIYMGTRPVTSHFRTGKSVVPPRRNKSKLIFTMMVCIQMCPMVHMVRTMDTVVVTDPVGWGRQVNGAKQKNNSRGLHRPITNTPIGTCRLGHGHVPGPPSASPNRQSYPTRVHWFVQPSANCQLPILKYGTASGSRLHNRNCDRLLEGCVTPAGRIP